MTSPRPTARVGRNRPFRSPEQILAKMVTLAKTEHCTKTTLKFMAWLNQKSLEHYLDEALSNGILVVSKEGIYTPTKKGLDLVEALQKVEEMARGSSS